MEDFMCAGAAAISSITVMHPVDVVKTKLQLQGENASHTGKHYGGIVSSLVKLGKKEGARGLYRGLTAAWGLQFCVNSTRFATYAFGKQLMGVNANSTLQHAQNFTLATFAATFGAFFGTPFYQIKTRFQAMSESAELAVGHQYQYSNLRGALRNIYQTEGIKGYFHGVNVFVPRVVAFGSVQLSTYDSCKQFLLRKGMPDVVIAHVAASACAASFAIAAMQPFDFVAARVMNQPYVDGKPLYYTGAIDCLRKSVQAEGITCLFKGMSANYARMVPYTILLFVFFEQYKRMFTRLKDTMR